MKTAVVIHKQLYILAFLFSNFGCRCYVSVVSIGDIIYACGGFDGLQRHKSVERYERNRNHWTLVKPMYHKRSDAGAASLRGPFSFYNSHINALSRFTGCG